MKLKKAKQEQPDNSIKLGQAKSGDCIRFVGDSIEEAFKSDLFYMVLEAPEAKGSVKIVNLSDGRQLVRDPDHKVVTHQVALEIQD